MVVEKARAASARRGIGLPGGFQLRHAQAVHDAKSDYLSFDIPVVVEIVESDEHPEADGRTRADHRRGPDRDPAGQGGPLCRASSS